MGEELKRDYFLTAKTVLHNNSGLSSFCFRSVTYSESYTMIKQVLLFTLLLNVVLTLLAEQNESSPAAAEQPGEILTIMNL